MVRNLSIIALLLICILAGLAVRDYYREPGKDLVIFYTSNMRGQIKPFSGVIQDHKYEQAGGFAFIKGYIKSLSNAFSFKKENTIILDTGDALFGSAEATLTMGEMPLKLMNKMGYDAMCIGNLEFEYGLETLRNFATQQNIPLLACNYKDTNNQNQNTFKDGIILEKSDSKIGIIGLGINELSRNTRLDNIINLEITDTVTSVNNTATKLKSQGAEIIILLSHEPIIANNIDVAKTFPQVDIILGDMISSNISSTGRPYICPTASSRGGGLGFIKIPFKENSWKFDTIIHGVYPVDASQIVPDQEMVQEINRYEEKIDSLLEEKITESKGVFTHSYTEESTIGSLVSDCIREISGAQIALTNSGGIKTSLGEGVVTLRKLYNIMPFENNIVVIEMTGAQLENVLESCLSGKTGFLQSSGLTCTYSSSNPAGFRIIQVDIGDQALEYNATYTVAVNDFMYNNSLDWPEFAQGKNPKVKGLIRESIVNYLKKQNFISPNTNKRFNDFQELDETLRVQALSYDLVTLKNPYINDGTNNSEYCRLIAETIRQEAKTDFAIIPVSMIKKTKEPLQIITPARIISDFQVATKLGVNIVEINGNTLKTILLQGLTQNSKEPLTVSGLSIEMTSGVEMAIHPWETAYSDENIYKVAISEELPLKIDGLYDIKKNLISKFSSDIRRTFINGLRNKNGEIELKRVFY